ncbi:hypothetical protein BVY04_02605, partial [bacterium M21]
EKLDILKLPEEERRAYERYQEELHLAASMMEYTVKVAEQSKEELQKTQSLLVSERERAELAAQREEEARRQKEEAKAREEEAKARAEEERRQKEEITEKAILSFMEMGKSREEARKLLGLD